MPESRSSLRIQRRIVIFFLLLCIPPLIIGHILLVNDARSAYQDLIGNYFSQRAEEAQVTLINYLEKEAVEVGNLGNIPEIQQVVQQANSVKHDKAELEKSIPLIEKDWPQLTPENSRLVNGILTNPASLFLRKFNSTVTTFREILVTDELGRLIASSNKSSDYYQADERWWLNAYQEGRGNRFISDLQFDESANAYGIEIAEPIREGSSGQVIGVIKAILDSHELFGLIETIRVGAGGDAVLMRSDGSVIFSPRATVRYEFPSAITGPNTRRRSTEAVEIQAGGEDRKVFVGLPPASLDARFPGLEWYVITEAPYEEVFSLFGNINTRFILIVIFSVIVVLILSVVFSWLLAKPVIETDPHLERL